MDFAAERSKALLQKCGIRFAANCSKPFAAKRSMDFAFISRLNGPKKPQKFTF
ncbi:MAG: hypothetical protein ACLQMT_07775 [Candidatus Acidiferrales bacterium]